jgi:hypothetical protein
MFNFAELHCRSKSSCLKFELPASLQKLIRTKKLYFRVIRATGALGSNLSASWVVLPRFWSLKTDGPAMVSRSVHMNYNPNGP